MTTAEMNSIKAVTVEFDVEVAMRDGVILRGDLALPSGPGRWPMLLLRSPYGKESPATEPFRNLSALARKGFAVMFQDARQRFRSEGEGDFQAFVSDAQDGEDTIRWAEEQPWCTGDVFGFHQSYHGFTQWATASRAPAALKAFAPGASPSIPVRTWLYYGGAFELSFCAGWWMMMGADTLLRRHKDDSVALKSAMDRYKAATEEMHAGNFDQLPLGNYPPFKKAGVGGTLLEMLRVGRGTGTAHLDALASAQDYGKVVAPALIWCGWYDLFIRGSIDQYVGMCKRGGSEAARSRTRLVIGPWTHAVLQGNVQGERDFGLHAAALAMPPRGLGEEILAFFRDTIAGKSPPKNRVNLFVMGANIWREEEDWPLARGQVTPWYLSSAGHANSGAGDGRIGPEPRPSPADNYLYDPAHPVPTYGGTNLTGVTGPRDQRFIEARDDVLVYTSDVLQTGLEVTGTTFVELWIETDVVDTDFVAKLVDVAPDGAAYQVAEGVQRARWRVDPLMETDGSPITPGEPTLIRIELTPTSNLFLPGHRLRLDITSSNFPRWQRNLNIWNQLDATLEGAKVARQRVLHDETHSSRVLLPVIPALLRGD